MAHGCHFYFLLFLSFSNFVTSKTYIVLVDKELKPSVFSQVQNWYQAILQTLHTNTDENSDQKQTILPLHVYNSVLNGFSAVLTRKQAAHLANKSGVMAVMPDRLHQLHTTRSPSFLGLYTDNNNNIPGHLLSMSDSGSNVIIAVIDTGIWPEHHSFSDVGLGAIPSTWKGECEEGQNFTASLCNKKIVGARIFTKGYEEEEGKIDPSENFMSARDANGHGTHIASTAAGRAVANASVFGYAKGTAVGVAPKARIAVYKVCWTNGCTESDIISAFDKAVEDGVDIISFSLNSGLENINPIAIGAFGAMEKGVLVSASAGNDGPGGSSLGNVAPWMTIVGASTMDRRFPADLVLGDGRVLKGSSLYSSNPLPKNTISIVYDEYCDSLDSEEVRGKIVVCIGDGVYYGQDVAVKSAGGVAMVMVIDKGLHGEDLPAFVHSIPSLTVTNPALQTIQDYIDHLGSKASATIVFHDTEFGIKPAPTVAALSSRGPTIVSPFLMKPDLIAPGVNILAAWPYGVSPSRLSSDPRRTEFNIFSGTSMSCPHISGVAALLKAAHPDWKPAMIRSAMMTTAYTKDNRGEQILDENDYTNAMVWAMGAGHVDPEKAVDPGLVYDISPDDYLNFLCASKYSIELIRSVTKSRSYSCSSCQSQPWNLNYPAITVDFNAYDKMVIMVKRTVTHVSNNSATYTVKVVDPKGVCVQVTPKVIKFNRRGEKQSYNVLIKARKLTVAPGESTTDVGKIVWSDGKRNVVSPVVMIWKNGLLISRTSSI